MADIRYLMPFEHTEIFVMRDDLLPFSYGGNKVRIAEELFAELKTQGCGAVISYGSPLSNMNRAVSAMAAREKIPCLAVIKGRREALPEGGEELPSNLRLTLLSGADLLFTEDGPVSGAVCEAEKRLRSRGLKPFYIYGDAFGKGNEEVLTRAYRKAYGEIRSFERETGRFFGNIFLASGTGATQAGLIAGSISRGEADLRRITGISAARDRARGVRAIEELLSASGFEDTKELIDFTDAYTKGYASEPDGELRELILAMHREHGLPLDPCYTGPAFYGMQKEIAARGLSGPVLFLHTGGRPIFEDYLLKLRSHCDTLKTP